jgi:preprotein translocase subunit SecG
VNIVEVLLWIFQFGLGLGLIFLVLIHSGRGGGLSDMFGGGLGASAAGSTVMEKNLDRITVVVALLFVFNTLIMALLLDT